MSHRPKMSEPAAPLPPVVSRAEESLSIQKQKKQGQNFFSLLQGKGTQAANPQNFFSKLLGE